MSGVIALTTGELGRFSECTASIIGMRKPPGTRVMITVGGSMAKAWNDIGARVLGSDAEWLMLLNDDHVYAVDTVECLLARNVDVVTGFYLHRHFPFAPVLYDKLETINGKEWYQIFSPPAGASGLWPIVGCGDGCMLIRRRVLEAIPPPIWEISKFLPDVQSTDLIFSEKIRQAGFQIWADLDVVVPHMIVAPVVPHVVGGQWRAALIQRDGVMIALPSGKAESLKGEES